jgi:hypothetical protein
MPVLQMHIGHGTEAADGRPNQVEAQAKEGKGRQAASAATQANGRPRKRRRHGHAEQGQRQSHQNFPHPIAIPTNEDDNAQQHPERDKKAATEEE